MMYRKCPICGKMKFLTAHHITPVRIKYICRSCHDKIHGTEQRKTHYNQKVNKGVCFRKHKKK